MKKAGKRTHTPLLVMTIETWKCNRSVCKDVADPDWKRIERAVRDMSANGCSSMILERSDGRLMAIGGDGTKYVAHVLLPDRRLYQLMNPKPPENREELVPLVVGGQDSYSVAKYVVGRSDVLAAARSFFASGEMDSQSHWELN